MDHCSRTKLGVDYLMVLLYTGSRMSHATEIGFLAAPTDMIARRANAQPVACGQPIVPNVTIEDGMYGFQAALHKTGDVPLLAGVYCKL